MINSHRIFLEPSVIFAAVFSETGGARQLFRLGEAGVVQLVVGPNVLRECEEVIRRKAPASLPTLALMLEYAGVEVCAGPQSDQLELAGTFVAFTPDAYVLAEALNAQVGWFVSHDKAHFLNSQVQTHLLPFQIGTPGDVLQDLANQFNQTE